MTFAADELGTQDIKKLLIKQAVPSSIGILFMSVNILIDTIFVGQWIGSLAIAAVTVVLPITFLISSLGMAIGVGGGSVLSRALGANDREKALLTFGNQIKMTFLLASIFVLFGLVFSDEMLLLFGAKGAILQPAKEFFIPIIISVPFLALCMMGNNVIRAEGKAKFAMMAMIIPAFVNIGLDILFIRYMNLGMFGAALATAISYTTCFLFDPESLTEQERELDDSLRRLPYDQRAVVVLRYWLGLTEAEIAESLDCRPGTVKSRLSRALRALRKELT